MHPLASPPSLAMIDSPSPTPGCRASVSFSDFFPATVNSPAEAKEAAAAAVAVVGAEHVDVDTRPPSMGAEDFGYILQQVAGGRVDGWVAGALAVL